MHSAWVLLPAMLTIGHFDAGGSPCTKITLRGLDGTKHTLDDVVIDTGFWGCLQLPMDRAMNIGLDEGPPVGSTLADSRRVIMETAYGEVEFQGYSRRALIALSPEMPRYLAGMDFLRIFRLALVVQPPSDVALIDQRLAWPDLSPE